MYSPVNEASEHSNASIPCNVPPTLQNLNTPNTAVMGNVNHIPHVYNVPPAFPMMNMSTAAPEWNVVFAVPQATKSSAFYQTFLKGKPKELGLVLIATSILQLALGFGMVFTEVYFSLYSGIPFWGPVFYNIAASLTISARNKPSICMVRGSFILNIINSVLSCIGIILSSMDIKSILFFSCNSIHGNFYEVCKKRATGGIVIHSILVITNLLVMCVSISIVIFGSRSLSDVPSAPQMFLVQNGVVVPALPSGLPATSQPQSIDQ